MFNKAAGVCRIALYTALERLWLVLPASLLGGIPALLVFAFIRDGESCALDLIVRLTESGLLGRFLLPIALLMLLMAARGSLPVSLLIRTGSRRAVGLFRLVQNAFFSLAWAVGLGLTFFWAGGLATGRWYDWDRAVSYHAIEWGEVSSAPAWAAVTVVILRIFLFLLASSAAALALEQLFKSGIVSLGGIVFGMLCSQGQWVHLLSRVLEPSGDLAALLSIAALTLLFALSVLVLFLALRRADLLGKGEKE